MNNTFRIYPIGIQSFEAIDGINNLMAKAKIKPINI